ncbi:hypothetical protein ASG37_07950 [Sphingomonas sp. Leaf407]|uniref:DUF445 domain-containing protein n=1 Tax=unclassified Sphingomonas TaxID=196159 RepID=UPI0007022F20|nr:MULTISPECIES: DUF445 domain-containing protein [unclassified Sphingomonas]KQN39481.1 hypothetical protein ASE97_05240 [Sphingomonas sp. Leaf42]KQT28757.1 hypothetical protein ASG37_07950 [Sphingomonas sp. Leaf407]
MPRSAGVVRGGDAVPPQLRRMRRVATGLLVAMAVLFLLSRRLHEVHSGWGYVQAFAEAAMVGGLADWFAVTALFRHPLGVPIPHTAIVPRNKDRIGDTLAAFLRDNFLTAHIVARRMRRFDLALAAGRWLADPMARSGRLRHGASRLAVNMLEALDPEQFGTTVRGALANRMRAWPVAPMLGRTLTTLVEGDRHLPLIDAVVRWTAKTLDANEDMVRDMIRKRAGSVLRWTGLDETLANSVLNGLRKMLDEVAADPAHPLRAKANEGLALLAHDLQHSPELQAKVERFKNELLDNPAVAAWWMGVWERIRAAMLAHARDPDRALNGPIGEALRQLGATLQSDAVLRAKVNRFARRAVVGGIADYGDGIVRLVSDTVRGWDAATITLRLENAVGRDLQYIRINGTLVGGLVGLVIHVVDVWL